jgi:hypothetical protein
MQSVKVLFFLFVPQYASEDCDIILLHETGAVNIVCNNAVFSLLVLVYRGSRYSTSR